MLRVFVLVLVSLAVFPGAASAAPGDAVGRFVGEMVWGTPACGTPQIVESTPEAYIAAHGSGYFNGDPIAWAAEDRCEIVINPHYKIRTAAKRCHVIVHEWGHLTGREHSSNSRSVMYGEDIVSEGRETVGRKRSKWVATGAFAPCVKWTKPGTGFG